MTSHPRPQNPLSKNRRASCSFSKLKCLCVFLLWLRSYWFGAGPLWAGPRLGSSFRPFSIEIASATSKPCQKIGERPVPFQIVIVCTCAFFGCGATGRARALSHSTLFQPKSSQNLKTLCKKLASVLFLFRAEIWACILPVTAQLLGGRGPSLISPFFNRYRAKT